MKYFSTKAEKSRSLKHWRRRKTMRENIMKSSAEILADKSMIDQLRNGTLKQRIVAKKLAKALGICDWYAKVVIDLRDIPWPIAIHAAVSIQLELKRRLNTPWFVYGYDGQINKRRLDWYHKKKGVGATGSGSTVTIQQPIHNAEIDSKIAQIVIEINQAEGVEIK